jgi:DNA processing protein
VRGGNQLPKLTARSVAVTGNRNATEQAITRTHAFATAVAEAGHTLTATLAYGVDSAAHRAAAQAGRATLAVLPLDRAHPHKHAQLLNLIPAAGRAVISLYRPGATATGATLQASARLVAALCRAMILTETLDHAKATPRPPTAPARRARQRQRPPARRAARRPGREPHSRAHPALRVQPPSNERTVPVPEHVDFLETVITTHPNDTDHTPLGSPTPSTHARPTPATPWQQ